MTSKKSVIALAVDETTCIRLDYSTYPSVLLELLRVHSEMEVEFLLLHGLTQPNHHPISI